MSVLYFSGFIYLNVVQLLPTLTVTLVDTEMEYNSYILLLELQLVKELH